MITSDQRAPARIGRIEQLSDHPDHDDFGNILNRQIDARAKLVIENNTPDLVEQVTQAVIRQLAEDPVAAIRDSGDIYTAEEIAHEMDVTVETVRGWTRLPDDDKRHLVRIEAHAHIRVLAWDFAEWIRANRS